MIAIASYFGGVAVFKKITFISDIFAGLAPVQKILANKYYVDELYQAIIVGPVAKISAFCSDVFDKYVVDGAVNGLGRNVRRIGTGLKAIQTGDLQTYALMMVSGLVVVLFLLFKVMV